MKKNILIIFVCALLALSGCGKGSQPEAMSFKDQISLIAGAADDWMDRDAPFHKSYALTDMDENGRLELVSSVCEGPGFFSTTDIWEVNEDYSGLAKLAFGDGKTSGPDFSFAESFRCYTVEGRNYLVVEDVDREGYGLTRYVRCYFSLKDGKIDSAPVAFCAVTAEDRDGNGEYEHYVTYYTPGNEGSPDLDGESYRREEEKLFSPAESRRVCNIKWIMAEDAANAGRAETELLLGDSWGGFGFGADTGIFEKLYFDPLDGYDVPVSDGRKDAGEVPVSTEAALGYWTALSIETDGVVSGVKDEDLICEGEVSDRGFARFYFQSQASSGGEAMNFEPMEITVEKTGIFESSYSPWHLSFSDGALNKFSVAPDAAGGLEMRWLQYLDNREDPAMCVIYFDRAEILPRFTGY